MEIISKETGRELTLTLRGELDHHGAKNVMQRMELALDAALPLKLILDFSQFANEENMAKLLPDVDYAFFSVGEGNEQKAVELLKQAKALGGSIMTATLGEDGCICYDGEIFYRGHSVRAEKVVNTVGAGDSFIAGFMEGIMKGMDIPACIRNGAELASTVVAQFEPY